MTTLKKGDEVSIEQAWESSDGHSHDEIATITKVYKDGTIRFHHKNWMIQAYLNRCGLRAEDVDIV